MNKYGSAPTQALSRLEALENGFGLRHALFYPVCIAALILLAIPMTGHAELVASRWPVSQGVDVSNYNGTINWSAVAGAGETFAITAATDGTSNVDPAFATNWAGIAAAGLIRGASDFFEPNLDPIAQAKWYLSHVGAFGPGTLPPILDVEITSDASDSQIFYGMQQWTSYVRAATGLNPIIYTSANFWAAIGNPILPCTVTFCTNLWIANWGVPVPNIPHPPWDRWVIWQYSGSGTVPGIPSSVGLDELQAGAFIDPISSVPLPASACLLLSGLVGVGAMARKRRAA